MANEKSYEKKTWVSGKTKLSAANFNHIETGINDIDNQVVKALDKIDIQATTITAIQSTLTYCNVATLPVVLLDIYGTDGTGGLKGKVADLEDTAITQEYIDENVVKKSDNIADILLEQDPSYDLAVIQEDAAKGGDAWDNLAYKQDKLTEGNNITISSTNVIDCKLPEPPIEVGIYKLEVYKELENEEEKIKYRWVKEEAE